MRLRTEDGVRAVSSLLADLIGAPARRVPYPAPPKKRTAKTIVHVNMHVVKANKKNNTSDPPLTIRRGKKTERAHEIEIDGPCKIVYSPEKPLKCGARVWIETHSPVSRVSNPF